MSSRTFTNLQYSEIMNTSATGTYSLISLVSSTGLFHHVHASYVTRYSKRYLRGPRGSASFKNWGSKLSLFSIWIFNNNDNLWQASANSGARAICGAQLRSIANVFKVPLQSLELQRWVKKPFEMFNCCEPLSLIFLTIMKCNIWMLK